MITKTLAIALALSAAAHVWQGLELAGAQAELAQVKAAQVAAALAYAENARTAEAAEAQRRQEIADAKDRTLRSVRAGLLADLERMRDRPDRVPSAGETPRPACSGATGAELSGPDAAFLTGLAARADELRAELAACQQREHARPLKATDAND